MKSMTYSQKQRVANQVVTGMGLNPSGSAGFLLSSLLADFPDVILFSLLKSFPIDKKLLDQ